jgi:HK97 gp10 family phage protein
MTGFTVKVEGLAEVTRRLELLPDRVGYRALRRALRKGANVIKAAAVTNAKQIDDPETAEKIWKNIAVAGGGRKREKQAGGPMMRVGVRGGARFNKGADGLPGGNTTGYWRLLEYGASHMTAQPFMRPAMNSAANGAFNAAATAMVTELDKELARLP